MEIYPFLPPQRPNITGVFSESVVYRCAQCDEVDAEALLWSETRFLLCGVHGETLFYTFISRLAFC
jgi:hypothetical protein